MTPPATKRLILMRHAKSNWEDPGVADEDRTLNPRGLRGARDLGPWLGSRGYLPDEVLCSTANRTRQTWDGIAASLPAGATLRLVPALYQAEADTILGVLRQATSPVVLLIGHNPGISEVAHRLPAQPPLHPGFEHYPTGATLVLDLDIRTWSDLVDGNGQVMDFITPRDLE